MHKKYVFLDLDGTILSHTTNSVPESTIKAIELLRENNHEVILATGRCPSLFYDIDKELGIDSYVAANGRYVVYKGKEILNQFMEEDDIDRLIEYAEKRKIDLAFEGKREYVLQSAYEEHYKKFSDYFHLHYPKVKPYYHKKNEVYQVILFGHNEYLDELKNLFPNLDFHISNDHGIDVNQQGGMKDIGVKAIVNALGISREDTIGIGDGNNDVSMIKYCGLGIAMGNAYESLKQVADIIAEDIDKDGLFKVLKEIKII